MPHILFWKLLTHAKLSPIRAFMALGKKNQKTKTHLQLSVHMSSSHASCQACSVTPVLSPTFQEPNAIGFHNRNTSRKHTICTQNENDKPVEGFDSKQVAPPDQTERRLWTLATLSYLIKPVKYYLEVLKIVSLSKKLLSTASAWLHLC